MKFSYICQPRILNEKLSVNTIIGDSEQKTDNFTKTPYFKLKFQVSKYTAEEQKFLTTFNSQHSQTTQQELAELLLK